MCVGVGVCGSVYVWYYFLFDLTEDVFESVLSRVWLLVPVDESSLGLIATPVGRVLAMASVFSSRSSSSRISGRLTSRGLPVPNIDDFLLWSDSSSVPTGLVRGNSTSGLRPSRDTGFDGSTGAAATQTQTLDNN